MKQFTFEIGPVEDWKTLAEKVVEHVSAPMILALSGPLGAGKTTFVQALAEVLGVEDRPRSPTFSLLRTYLVPREQKGIRRLVHIDAYRLEKASDVYALDLEGEFAEPGTIVAMEWPEQVGDALLAYGVPILHIGIQVLDTGHRMVLLNA